MYFGGTHFDRESRSTAALPFNAPDAGVLAVKLVGYAALRVSRGGSTLPASKTSTFRCRSTRLSERSGRFISAVLLNGPIANRDWWTISGSSQGMPRPEVIVPHGDFPAEENLRRIEMAALNEAKFTRFAR